MVSGSPPAPEISSQSWIDIHITVQGAHVDTTFGGRHAEGDVGPLARGIFGITAATGTSTVGVSVRNFRGTFASCPPAP
jgi:hypothetical protein